MTAMHILTSCSSMLHTRFSRMRKLGNYFDDLLRIRRDKVHRRSQHDSKRQRMMSDLEKREQAAFGPDPAAKAQEEEQIISMKLKEEIARIRAMQANKVASTTPTQRKEATVGGRESSMDGGGSGLDKEKVLKVSWEKIGDDYSAQRLRELFEKFGEVEDVVIKSSKKTLKKGSALVVMASKDAAVAATGTMCRDLTNPLLVLPLQPTIATAFTWPHEHVEPDGPKLNNLVGAGYQSFEASVLKKLMQKDCWGRNWNLPHRQTGADFCSNKQPSDLLSAVVVWLANASYTLFWQCPKGHALGQPCGASSVQKLDLNYMQTMPLGGCPGNESCGWRRSAEGAYDTRNIFQSLDLAWTLLRIFPRELLHRIPAKTLDQYHSRDAVN
ncbi:DNAJ heat shock N-terminal domain-containing protein [Actinidia rufa]|uniref:DNAJ heat shock N-terminal domain-containing protein n=1 Tax=Actinidia rufa TaxID=165716 RepID=A0A7J0FPB5_9ERIC|nr:DNAJ heat shock N-terminal domain-containing protein [Actinidia rufa]